MYGLREARQTNQSLSRFANVNPRVNMWLAAEVPHHRRTFDLPYVPDFIVANVLVFVIREVQFVEAVLIHKLHRLFAILLTEGSQ